MNDTTAPWRCNGCDISYIGGIRYHNKGLNYCQDCHKASHQERLIEALREIAEEICVLRNVLVDK